MQIPRESGTGPSPPAGSRPPKRYTVAKILVAAGLLVWLARSGRLDFRVLLAAPLSPLHALGVLVLFVVMVLQAWRWWWLLKAQHIELSYGRALGLVWMGRFLALVLPGGVGGDLVRGYYIVREAPSTKMAGLSSILLDRVLGLCASFLLGLFALVWMFASGEPLTGPLLHMGVAIVLMLVGVILLFLLLRLERTRNRILRFLPGRARAPLEAVLEAYGARGRSLWACLGLSLVIGALAMGAFVIAGRLLESPIGWGQAFVVCPLVFVALTLPISPAGLGVGETAASVLFAPFGVETGATVMLLVRLWFLLLWLPGGVLYVLDRGRTALTEEGTRGRP